MRPSSSSRWADTSSSRDSDHANVAGRHVFADDSARLTHGPAEAVGDLFESRGPRPHCSRNARAGSGAFERSIARGMSPGARLRASDPPDFVRDARVIE